MLNRIKSFLFVSSIFVFLFVAAQTILLSAPTPLTLRVDWLDQVASGLRIVKTRITLQQAADSVTIRNVSKQVITGFVLSLMVGSDSRLDPTTKVTPTELKHSDVLYVNLAPGQEFQVTSFAVRLNDLVQASIGRGIKIPIFRIGVKRVIYAGGNEQNFDLLKDPQASRSDAPPDLGGLKPQACGYRPKPRLVMASLIKPPGPEPQIQCNWQMCTVICLDPPDCTSYILGCESAPRDCHADPAACDQRPCSF